MKTKNSKPVQNPADGSESPVHGTRADRMPDPAKQNAGETEERARDAFQGRPLILPETQGDIADRAFQDQEAEIEEQVARIRRRGRG